MKPLCYFCLEGEQSTLVTDRNPEGGLLDFWLCDKCAKDKIKADAIREGEATEFLDRDPSPLCTQCGICCFMLHAKVTKEEVEEMVKEHGIEPETFAVPTPLFLGPTEGEMSIKMPCKFLLGRPLNWAGCSIHEKYRPSVCESYICKVAAQYKTGICSLGEARYWLRSAFLTGDYSIFNWVKSGDEVKVLLSSTVGSYIKSLKGRGASEEEIKMGMAHMVTPHYRLDGPTAQFIMNMHLSVADRGDFDPRVFFTPLKMKRLEALGSAEDIARVVIKEVMTTILSLHVRQSESLEELMQIHGDKAEVIKKELTKKSIKENYD